MKGIIYKWTCNISGKSYIGQTINEKKREKEFLTEGSYAGKKIDNARKKYGLSDGVWTKEVLKRLWCKDGKEDDLFERLNYWERFYIKEYDTFHHGYNSTDGGDRFKISDDVINELRIANKKRWYDMPEEEKERIRQLGREQWDSMPEDEKEKHRERSRRLWKNKEYRERIRNANIGKYNGHSIVKIIKSSNSHKGISRSLEVRKKISDSIKKQSINCCKYKVIKYDKKGGTILESYDSIREATISCGLAGNNHFAERIKSNDGIYRGFYWEIVKPNKENIAPVGCCWVKRLKRWRSEIGANGKNYLLGHYINKDAASEIYQEAKREKENGNFDVWYSNIINHKIRMYEKYNEKAKTS